MADFGIEDVGIGGGEPFVRKDLVEIVALILLGFVGGKYMTKVKRDLYLRLELRTTIRRLREM